MNIKRICSASTRGTDCLLQLTNNYIVSVSVWHFRWATTANHLHRGLNAWRSEVADYALSLWLLPVAYYPVSEQSSTKSMERSIDGIATSVRRHCNNHWTATINQMGIFRHGTNSCNRPAPPLVSRFFLAATRRCCQEVLITDKRHSFDDCSFRMCHCLRIFDFSTIRVEPSSPF